MTIAVWFDGDETLWDRRGFMLTGLESELNGPHAGCTHEPELFPDVLPTFVALTELGTVNLLKYTDLPDGHDDLLPPFHHRLDGPASPTGAAPSLHTTESCLNWIEVTRDIAAASQDADDIVIVSNNLAAFRLAAERGWLSVWLNRDRVANLADILPDAEIHSLLDLPDVLESMQEAREDAAAGRSPVSPA